jgi:hypothetical protein
VKKVGENPKHLEDMTGLTDLLNDTALLEGVIGKYRYYITNSGLIKSHEKCAVRKCFPAVFCYGGYRAVAPD